MMLALPPESAVSTGASRWARSVAVTAMVISLPMLVIGVRAGLNREERPRSSGALSCPVPIDANLAGALDLAQQQEVALRQNLAILEVAIGYARGTCPKVQPPVLAPPNVPPEASKAQGCAEHSESGSGVLQERRIHVGNRPGRVTMKYDAESIPDQIEIFYNGKKVSGTDGYVSGKGFLWFDFTPYNGDEYISVIVRSNNSGTSWGFEMSCPR